MSAESATRLLPKVYLLGYKAGESLSAYWRSEIPRPTVSQVYSAITSFPALYKDWWLTLFANDPIHVYVETTLLLSIVYIIISTRRKSDWRKSHEKLTTAEEKELLREWKETRAPLAPTMDDYEDDNTLDFVVHENKGKEMVIEWNGQLKKVLNLATFDFLGMSSDDPLVKSIKDEAHSALDKYGCGSCGPRGFYGTIDAHLQLEYAFAEHMKTEQAIMYSDGASTCSSTVAAFAKRGDLVVVDEAIYEPLRTGVMLSRAHVKWFKHNDMQDLRRVLEEIQANDKRLGRKPNAQRRFIVVEGLYKNTGTIVPLDELVALKHEFSYRLILDESFSFGCLGKTGRGVVELYNLKLMKDAEIVTVSLENAIGSIGGVTIGTEEVVDHQRLCGSGYCFSASAPPFTAKVAIASLQIMQNPKADLLQRLADNRVYMYEKLKSLCKKVKVVEVTSDERSPIVMLTVARIQETEYLDEIAFGQEVVRECLERGIAFGATGQSIEGPVRSEVPPGIRVTVSAALTHADIDRALTALNESIDAVMTRFHEESL